MTPQPLTKRQREVFDLVKTEIAAHHVAPTIAEIGIRLGLSSLATVCKHLQTLTEKGYIRRRRNSSRSIEIVATEGTCPHCGQAMPA